MRYHHMFANAGIIFHYKQQKLQSLQKNINKLIAYIGISNEVNSP